MSFYLVNAGYLLMFLALVARDILFLRILLLGAQALLALAGWVMGMAPVFFWNSIFLVVNVVWIIRIVRERRPVELPLDLRDIYQKTFQALSPPEFLQWWDTGHDRAVPAGELFVQEGETPVYIFMIMKGRAVAERQGRKLGNLERGSFIGDMSFLTRRGASADVRAAEGLELRAWRQADLHRLSEENPPVFIKLQGILGADVAEKLRTANATLHQFKPEEIV